MITPINRGLHRLKDDYTDFLTMISSFIRTFAHQKIAHPPNLLIFS